MNKDNSNKENGNILYFPVMIVHWRRLIKRAGNNPERLRIVAEALCTELEFREHVCTIRQCAIPRLIDVRILM